MNQIMNNLNSDETFHVWQDNQSGEAFISEYGSGEGPFCMGLSCFKGSYRECLNELLEYDDDWRLTPPRHIIKNILK